jgi:hypothetical protein
MNEEGETSDSSESIESTEAGLDITPPILVAPIISQPVESSIQASTTPTTKLVNTTATTKLAIITTTTKIPTTIKPCIAVCPDVGTIDVSIKIVNI